ncbi:MAG: hypothetical protein ABSE48_00275 [Verrucomicrobiota bacterium]|jgi:hypothetical protein
MKSSGSNLGFILLSVVSRHRRFIAAFWLIFFTTVPGEFAQTTMLVPVKGFSSGEFTSDQFFEPPNEQLVHMRLSGASASPLPGGALDITDLKIKTFYISGKTQSILQAPQCTYMVLDGIASSPGHLELQSGDGNMDTTGDGFLWRQSDYSLTISNNVHTVIKTGFFKLIAP